MRISLCVICGNEESNILAFLDSFAPAFDELSLCRAIGAQTPDQTYNLALEWCESHAKDFTFTEYKNAVDSATWPHVDDFAAARHASFSAGRGDWLVWADCDDTLQNAADLRAVLADPNTGDLARFEYDVPGTNKRPLRERAIRRTFYGVGRNRWVFPVHENLLVAAGTKVTTHPSPVWFHKPKPQALVNRRRNKQILSRTLQHSAANYFYLHQECTCEGNPRTATKWGMVALACPDLDPSFRYETNLNLAKITPDNDVALRYALDAHAVLPWCREAMAMLALIFIERQDPERALHWAEKLNAAPLPDENHRPWTHEPKWYGWAALDLLARCQRFADRPDDAEKTQRLLHEGNQARPTKRTEYSRAGVCKPSPIKEEPENPSAKITPISSCPSLPSVKCIGPLFSLIHATRGRTTKAAECRNQWLNLAAEPHRIQHIWCVDSDDRKTLHFAKQFEHVVNEVHTCVAAWNQGAAYSSGKILIQLSDDWVPFPGWDTAILAELERAGKTVDDEWVLAISDGHRKDDLLCMAILSRARYEKQVESDPLTPSVPHSLTPFLFHPDYTGVFSDNHFTHHAYKDGVVIDARARITFHHLHPAFGDAPMDETYARQNDPKKYEKGEAIFHRLNPDAK